MKEYLDTNGGVRVYRDGLRVYDYGEVGNDWLNLDIRRVNQPGKKLSNNIILGAISLDRASSKSLIEKTNREGFIEDDVYIAFRDAVNHVLSIFVRYRNEDKSRLTTLYKSNKAIEPVLAELDDAISLVEEKVTNKTDKELILNCLLRVDKQYKEVKDVLLKSANAGLNISVVIHEIDKQHAAYETYCPEDPDRRKVLHGIVAVALKDAVSH